MQARNGNGSVASLLPVGISTALLLLAIIGGFWSLADPRSQFTRMEWRIDQLENRQREGLSIIARHDEIIKTTQAEQARRTDTYVRTDKYVDAHRRLEIDLARIQALLDNAFPTTKVFDQINDRLKRLEEWNRSPPPLVSIQPTKEK